MGEAGSVDSAGTEYGEGEVLRETAFVRTTFEREVGVARLVGGARTVE